MAFFFRLILLGDSFFPVILVPQDDFGQSFVGFLFICLLLCLSGFIHGTVSENMPMLMTLSALEGNVFIVYTLQPDFIPEY